MMNQIILKPTEKSINRKWASRIFPWVIVITAIVIGFVLLSAIADNTQMWIARIIAMLFILACIWNMRRPILGKYYILTNDAIYIGKNPKEKNKILFSEIEELVFCTYDKNSSDFYQIKFMSNKGKELFRLEKEQGNLDILIAALEKDGAVPAEDIEKFMFYTDMNKAMQKWEAFCQNGNFDAIADKYGVYNPLVVSISKGIPSTKIIFICVSIAVISSMAYFIPIIKIFLIKEMEIPFKLLMAFMHMPLLILPLGYMASYLCRFFAPNKIQFTNTGIYLPRKDHDNFMSIRDIKKVSMVNGVLSIYNYSSEKILEIPNSVSNFDEVQEYFALFNLMPKCNFLKSIEIAGPQSVNTIEEKETCFTTSDGIKLSDICVIVVVSIIFLLSYFWMPKGILKTITIAAFLIIVITQLIQMLQANIFVIKDGYISQYFFFKKINTCSVSDVAYVKKTMVMSYIKGKQKYEQAWLLLDKSGKQLIVIKESTDRYHQFFEYFRQNGIKIIY